jgi:hypothetical protein
MVNGVELSWPKFGVQLSSWEKEEKDNSNTQKDSSILLIANNLMCKIHTIS